jgi:GNAT superfamily N-acetyltransferase
MTTDVVEDRPLQAALPLWPKTRVEQIAALIQLLATRHAGRERGIGAEALARTLGIHERLLRALVSQAREQGCAISATPETGYYVALTAAELEESCEFLRSRAMHSLRIEAQLRRIPLQDLLGQLHLPT